MRDSQQAQNPAFLGANGGLLDVMGRISAGIHEETK
jgi:hypothetical protein